jgi:hypothetical protein
MSGKAASLRFGLNSTCSATIETLDRDCPSGPVHRSCLRRPTTRTPRPFDRDSPQTSARRDQVVTSKNVTFVPVGHEREAADCRSLRGVLQLSILHGVGSIPGFTFSPHRVRNVVCESAELTSRITPQ